MQQIISGLSEEEIQMSWAKDLAGIEVYEKVFTL